MAKDTLQLEPIVKRVTVQVLQEKLAGKVDQELQHIAEAHARKVVTEWVAKNRSKLNTLLDKHMAKQLDKAKKQAVKNFASYIRDMSIYVDS